MTPPSQRYRQIAFYLSGGGPDVNFTFALRPEELTRDEPSRIAVQQTLGGAWADCFGEGIKTINLSGHNGWRGSLLLSGEDLFAAMKAAVFTQWHQRRAQLVSQGSDPDVVTLTFADNLDNIASLVVPMTFRLQRSRARPLLMIYNIQLLELGPAGGAGSIIDQIIDALSNPEAWILAQAGLTNDVAQLQSFVTQAQNVLGAAAAAAGQFTSMATSLFTSVASTAQSVQGQFDSSVSTILSLGSTVAQAGRNAFSALAGAPGLSNDQMIPLIDMSATFNDVACLTANGFNSQSSFTTFDALLGASACSSTSGGDPINPFTAAGANPLADLFAATTAPILATPAAVNALAFLLTDPLLLIGQPAAITSALQTAAAGVTLP